MFPVAKYGKALAEIAAKKNISCHLQHLVKTVDGANKKVTFENLTNGETVETDFDLLHIVPPQTPHKVVSESELAAPSGFVDVD